MSTHPLVHLVHLVLFVVEVVDVFDEQRPQPRVPEQGRQDPSSSLREAIGMTPMWGAGLRFHGPDTSGPCDDNCQPNGMWRVGASRYSDPLFSRMR